MKMSDALSLLGLGTEQEVSKEQATKAYRRASSKYHPDRNPAGAEMMKSINAAWDYLKTLFADSDTLNNSKAANDEKQASDYGEALNEAINAVINCEGLNIEVCGSWGWVSGNTKPHKDTLKEANFKWASKKKQWYFRPDNYRSTKRMKPWDMDQIRKEYGSSKPAKKENQSLKSPKAA